MFYVQGDSTDHVSADITSLVHKWVNNRVANYGLLVKVEADGVSLINRTFDEMNRTVVRPFFFFFFSLHLQSLDSEYSNPQLFIRFD